MELHCDAPHCTASVELMPGVPRRHHNWGRVTFYEETPADYDLCPAHYKAVLEGLWGTRA